MEKVRPRCGQPSDRGRLRNRIEQSESRRQSTRVAATVRRRVVTTVVRPTCESGRGDRPVLSVGADREGEGEKRDGSFMSTTDAREVWKRIVDFTREGREWRALPVGNDIRRNDSSTTRVMTTARGSRDHRR